MARAIMALTAHATFVEPAAAGAVTEAQHSVGPELPHSLAHDNTIGVAR